MSFWKKSVSPPGDEMKTIVYRGGVVTFRIPSHWYEEYSDYDGGTFYEDDPDAGTLRLRLTLLLASKPLHSSSAIEVLKVIVDKQRSEGVEGLTKIRPDGNAVFSYEQATSERGTPLTIFYWVVANPLPPSHARIATFSYTVLTEKRNDATTQRELETLETEIEAATFSPQVGEIPE